MNNPAKPDLLLLDIYGSLLDMSDVRAKVNRLLDSKRGYALWMEMVLHYSLVHNATVYADFIDIGQACMKMACASFGVGFDDDKFQRIIDLYRQLPIQENAQEGLSILQDNFRLSALTNFPASIVNDRMERTGLVSYFEHITSAGELKKYKPASEAYLLAAKKAELPVARIMMVSSHSWDIIGAMNAGLKAAYIEKGSAQAYPLSPQPFCVCKDLLQLAKHLKEHISV